MGGAGEGGVDVPVASGESGDQIIRCAAVHRRRAGRERRPAIGHGRQELELHLDQSGAVFGEVSVRGEHHGDRFADVNGLVGREDQTIALLFVGAVGEGDGETIGPGDGTDVVRGEHREHARQFERGARVDRDDPRMGVRAAHETRVQHARHVNIGDEARLAAQQVPVFDPGGRLSDERGHGFGTSTTRPATRRSTTSCSAWAKSSRGRVTVGAGLSLPASNSANISCMHCAISSGVRLR